MFDPIFLNRRTIDGLKKLKRVSTSTVMVLAEATKQGISWEKMPVTDVFKLAYKNEEQYFHAQIPSKTTEVAFYICKNKRISRNILEKAGLSVAEGYFVQSDDQKKFIDKIYSKLSKPIVVKPVDDAQGKNVHLNISNKKKYIEATKKIFSSYSGTKKGLMVEEMFAGDEYRILASREKVLSVIKRIPANVIGDGKSTIKDLITEKNQHPLRGERFTLNIIVVDDELKDFLSGQNLTIDSCPEKGQQIFLRKHSPHDISRGGDTIDVTNEIHPTVKNISLRAINAIPGLSLMGMDFMTKDITKPQTKNNYRIIEINASPSIDWNTYPVVGEFKNIPYEFLRIMFPSLPKE